jgi:hypothetical protein
MKYRIKLMSKDEIYITEPEYQALIKSNSSGLTFIPSLKGTVNLNCVESILPEELVPKKELSEGRLHDGTRVVKQFGVWKDAINTELWLDPNHYPEVAQDCVASEAEFEQLKELPVAERLQKMLGGSEAKQIASGEGLKKISFN